MIGIENLDIDFKNTDKNWDIATKWLSHINSGKLETYEQPHWSFDCNFKLDFDGPFLRWNSRFYRELKAGEWLWSGDVDLMFKDGQVTPTQSFVDKELTTLISDVEKYVADVESKIVEAISGALG